MPNAELEEIYALYVANKRGRKEMFRAIIDAINALEDRDVKPKGKPGRPRKTIPPGILEARAD